MLELIELFKQWVLEYQDLLTSSDQGVADLESFMQGQAKNSNPHTNALLNTVAAAFGLVKNASVNSIQAGIFDLLADCEVVHEKIDSLSANRQKMLENALCELKLDLQARFYIAALNEYGVFLEESNRKRRNRQKKLNQKDKELLEKISEALESELPTTMKEVEAYSDAVKKLDHLHTSISEDCRFIRAEMKEIAGVVEQMESGFLKPSAKVIDEIVQKTISSCLKQHCFGDAFGDIALNEKCKTVCLLMSQLDIFTQEIPYHPDEFPKVTDFAIKYQRFAKTHQKLKEKISKIQQTPHYFQSLLCNEMAVHADFFAPDQQAGVEIKVMLEKYEKAFDGSCQAIKSEYDELYSRDNTNKELRDEKIPYVRDDLIERMRIKIREESYILERLRFNRGQFQQVDGECFDKLKAAYFNTGSSKRIIASLEKHAKGHPRKENLINEFLKSVRESHNLEEFIRYHKMAAQFRELIDCKTEIGRKLGMMSTTGHLIVELNKTMDSLIKAEKSEGQIFKSVAASIEDEKKEYLAKNIENFYDNLYKNFLDVVKKLEPCKEIETLKEELMYISLWRASNDAKRSRLAMAVEHTRAVLISRKVPAPEIKIFADFLRVNSLYPSAYQYQVFPFSARYQALRNSLASTTTFRSTDKLWLDLDKIAALDESEVQKMDRMRDVVFGFYREVRQSRFGSAGVLFGRGSRLGDALESFLTDKNGFNIRKELVPHRMSNEPLLCKPFFANFVVGFWPLSCLFDAGSVPFFEMLIFWV